MFFEALGRPVMDFGFSGIKSFEEYLGKRLTKLLAILVGLALAAFSMRILWDNLVHPLLVFFQTPHWGQTLGNLVWAAVTIAAGVTGGLYLTAALNSWRYSRQLKMTKAELESLERIYTQVEQMQASADAMVDQSQRTVDGSFRVLDKALPSAKRWIERDPNLSEQERGDLIRQIDEQWRELNAARKGD